MYNPKRLIFAATLLLLMVTSCTTVKPYQRQYLNDPEMRIGNTSANFENYVHSIREGMIIPGAKKSGDGCGCN